MGVLQTATKGTLGFLTVGAGIGMGLACVGFARAVQQKRGEPMHKAIAKAAIRGYMDLSEKMNELSEEAREQLNDMRAEIEAERKPVEHVEPESPETARAAEEDGRMLVYGEKR